MAELIIVNNGKQPVKTQYAGVNGIRVIDSPENVGWEGGLKLGVENSDSEFIVFQNDDTYIPNNSVRFYQNLLFNFFDKNVAAVGPSTTTAAGIQSTYNPNSPMCITEVNWLIFFTVMVRRSHLMEVGGIDTSLPGGDDFDLCMRFRKAGYKILVNPQSFIIHHGFKTGTRVHGDHNSDGGWNSIKMTDRTNHALIVKHGFKAFYGTITSQVVDHYNYSFVDKEGDIIRSMITDEDVKVVELGCGPKKTLDRAIGVDRVKNGEKIPNLGELLSCADIVSNVEEPLPFQPKSQDVVIARHILEHCVDTISTLTKWKSILKPGGKLIIAVPNEYLNSTIPLNPEHVHAFTPDSLGNILHLLGFSKIDFCDSMNGVSFVMSATVPLKSNYTATTQTFDLDRLYDGDISTVPYSEMVRSL